MAWSSNICHRRLWGLHRTHIVGWRRLGHNHLWRVHQNLRWLEGRDRLQTAVLPNNKRNHGNDGENEGEKDIDGSSFGRHVGAHCGLRSYNLVYATNQ